MRKLLYVLLLVPLFFVPLHRVNVGNLLPVEAVAVYKAGDRVVLETDTDHMGKGRTLQEALADLKENVSAVIYLDTTTYLLISENALDQIESLRKVLKPSVKVSVCNAKGSVKDTVQYLKIHQKLPKLKDFSAPSTA